EQLEQWVKDAGLSIRPNLRDSRFAALVRTDPEEALKQIGQQAPPMEYRSALLLARSLTPSQPRKRRGNDQAEQKRQIALKCVERAVARCDDLNSDERVFAKAEPGVLFFRLGEAARGKALVEEAAQEWSRVPQTETSPARFVVLSIAQGLSWTDIP